MSFVKCCFLSCLILWVSPQVVLVCSCSLVSIMLSVNYDIRMTRVHKNRNNKLRTHWQNQPSPLKKEENNTCTCIYRHDPIFLNMHIWYFRHLQWIFREFTCMNISAFWQDDQSYYFPTVFTYYIRGSCKLHKEIRDHFEKLHKGLGENHLVSCN